MSLRYAGSTCLTYVNGGIKLTHVETTQAYLRKEEFDALRKAAARSRRSAAALVCDAIRKVVLMPRPKVPSRSGTASRSAVRLSTIAFTTRHDPARRADPHKLSAVDATSFAIMKRARIRLAYTFDHHFAGVGFRIVG
jgi:hypothetical protein